MIKGVIALIVADATCQTLIGQATIDGATTYKVFAVVAPQECPKPYVTIRRVPGSSTIAKGQVSDADTQNFRVVVFADRYKICMDILAAVRTAIDNKRGSQGGVNYDRIWYQFSEDLFDKDDNSYVIADQYTAIELR
jgi:hypothetical protein